MDKNVEVDVIGEVWMKKEKFGWKGRSLNKIGEVWMKKERYGWKGISSDEKGEVEKYMKEIEEVWKYTGRKVHESNWRSMKVHW